MRRRLVVIVAACAAPAAKSSTGGACLTSQEAHAEAIRALQRNDERFRAELAKRELAITTLPEEVAVAREVDEPGAIVTHEIDGVATRVLVGPTYIVCDPQGLELAKDPKGELFVIERHPIRAQPDYITACGCQDYPPGRCGGAAPETMQRFYVLPLDVQYKGKATIEYAEDATTVLFKTPDHGCKPPPPPPP